MSVTLTSPMSFLRDLVMIDWDSRCERLFATSVVLFLNSEGLAISLSLVALTLSRSEW